MPPAGSNLLCGATIDRLSKNGRASRESLSPRVPLFEWVEEYDRISDWNALQQPNGFELLLVFLLLVRANGLCETMPNDFDLLKP
jgi:hypothetical protein